MYKIRFRKYISIYSILLFWIPSHSHAQPLAISKYGVPVLDQMSQYRTLLAADSCEKMVELKTLIPGLQYDLRYAGTANFMHRAFYPTGTASSFLRAPAAEALARVQARLNRKGLGLLVFDAYRPYSLTVAFWEKIRDERYVAPPTHGSGHNRGLAVDLTLIQLKKGTPLDMGTGFDNFSDSAHWDFQGLSRKQQHNRNLLRKVMMEEGFQPLGTEWWHFFWPNDRNYPVLDLPFDSLRLTEGAY